MREMIIKNRANVLAGSSWNRDERNIIIILKSIFVYYKDIYFFFSKKFLNSIIVFAFLRF